MFVDRTAGFRATHLPQQSSGDAYRSLWSTKAALVKEGEALIATAGPSGELAQKVGCFHQGK